MDLKFPPINLWNVPRINGATATMINEHDIKDWKNAFGVTDKQLASRLLTQEEYQRIDPNQALPKAEYRLPSGVKHDQGKPRMDLLDADASEGLAAVLTFGANKYAAYNWRGGLQYSRLIAALLRHLMAIQRAIRN